MARFGLAGFLHETNTFAPGRTTYDDFVTSVGDETGLRRGAEIAEFKRKEMNLAPSGFMRRAEALGHEVIPLVWTSAMPSGTIVQDAFDQIMELITTELAAKGPFDGVFLDLHGAMVSEEYEDPETEIARGVRAVIGNIPLVASLDLHGNITSECMEIFSGLVAYRTYPHVDIYETGERCAIMLDHLVKTGPLAKAFRKLPFLMPPSLMSTMTEPARSLYTLIEQFEREGRIFSASFLHGFTPADIYAVGPAILVYAQDSAAAERAAADLEEAVLAREADLSLKMLTPDEAVRVAMQKAAETDKPVILADVQDNPGGGATSDTVWILEALVRLEAQDAAVGLIYDPQAAEKAHAAGEGASVSIDLGGKGMPGHVPFKGDFHVEKLAEGEFELTGPMNRGLTGNLGKMAQLRINGVRVVVVSGRTQANDQAYFRRVGIEPAEMKILSLKSTNHYRADFQPIASEIIVVDAPGAIIENPARIPYTRLREGVRLGALGPGYTRRE